MSQTSSSVLQPVSAGVLAVIQERRVSHVLMAADDEGTQALDALGRLIRIEASETAPALGPDTVRISVGGGPEPGCASDLHVYTAALRGAPSHHRGARLRASTAAALPELLDDLIALTEHGLIAVRPDDVRWLLTRVPRAAGAHISVPLESHRWLEELRASVTGPDAVMASVRVPGLRPGDELGFEAMSQVQLTFDAAAHILINAVPARGQAAHIGLFVWP